MAAYIDNPAFSSHLKRLEIVFGEMEGYHDLLQAVGKCGSKNLDSICAAPLLTKAQEKHLFLQYNALKCEALHHRSQKIYCERLLRKAKNIKDILMMCNMRIVVDFVKKTMIACDPQKFDDLFWTRFSDCVTFLTKGIEGFNVFYGYKFGTYCTWVLRNNFRKLMAQEHNKSKRLCFLNPQVLFGTYEGDGANLDRVSKIKNTCPIIKNHSFNFRSDAKPNTQLEDQELVNYVFEASGLNQEEIEIYCQKRVDNSRESVDNVVRRNVNRKVKNFVNQNRELAEAI